MLRPRPSNLYPTRDSHGTSKTLENPTTCKFGKPMPDGSNSSDLKVTSSTMKEAKSSDLKTKTTSLLEQMEMENVPDGTSSGSIRCSNTRKVNSILNMECTAKETSILLPRKAQTNILMS